MSEKPANEGLDSTIDMPVIGTNPESNEALRQELEDLLVEIRNEFAAAVGIELLKNELAQNLGDKAMEFGIRFDSITRQLHPLPYDYTPGVYAVRVRLTDFVEACSKVGNTDQEKTAEDYGSVNDTRNILEDQINRTLELINRYHYPKQS